MLSVLIDKDGLNGEMSGWDILAMLTGIHESPGNACCLNSSIVSLRPVNPPTPLSGLIPGVAGHRYQPGCQLSSFFLILNGSVACPACHTSVEWFADLSFLSFQRQHKQSKY